MAVRDIACPRGSRRAILFGLMLATASSALAQAQQGPAAQSPAEEEQAEEDARSERDIVVTGSRIRRAGFETLQPAVVLDGEALDQRAVTNFADALNELPAFGVPAAPTGDQAGLGVGVNFANFLGLGSQRTLTLVDGRRFPPANPPTVGGPAAPGIQVDLNSIPLALIDRVETIAVGGAPIYGTDAIAGTVNIILKHDFEGFEAALQSGISQRGDAARYRAQALYGLAVAGGRGNVAVNLEWNRQESLLQAERRSTAIQYSFQAPPPGSGSPFSSVITPNSRVAISNFFGVPLIARSAFNIFGGGVRNQAGQLTQFGAGGDLIPFDPGSPTGSPIFFSGGDGFSLADTSAIIVDLERYYANVFVNYELADSTRLRLEGWYAHTDAFEPSNQVDFNSVAFLTPLDRDDRVLAGPVPIRLDNAFLTDQARSIIMRAIDFNRDGIPDNVLDLNADGLRDTPGFYVDIVHQDVISGGSVRASRTMYRGLAALEGEFDLGERIFDWDLAYAYGRTTGRSSQPRIQIDRFNQAIDAVIGPDGAIACRDPSDGCAPLNIFGPGSSSEAARSFVIAEATTNARIIQHLVSANLSGSLLSLPAGEVGIAFGADYRRESSAFEPDIISSSGAIRGAPLTPLRGAIDTKEIYGEIRVPLVAPRQDFPVLHRLEVEAAARLVDHSSAGTDLTWTAGGRMAMIQDIEFRGNYTRSIRAPSVTELFLPTAPIFTRANDPCDTRFLTRGPDPIRRAANCAADGIIQPFSSLIVDAAQPASASGDPNLRNERADAWTVGVIVRPRFIPSLSIAVDWIDIELTDAIELLNGQTILEACYDSADPPTAEVCDRFTRTSTGQVQGLRTGYVNAGALNFAGLVADISFRTMLANIGTLGLSANYFYLDQLDFSVTGSDFNPAAGEIANSHHRAGGTVSLERDDLSLFTQVQYIGKAVFDLADGSTTRDVRGVGDFWLVNAGIRFNVNPRFELQLNVDNVFDVEPPRFAILLGGAGNPALNTYFSGVMGRYFSATARTRF